MFVRNAVSTLVLGLLLFIALPVMASEPTVVDEDRQRIQAHLAEVESELRERDISHLSNELQQERERNLDVLREYRRAGEFPRNTHVPWRHPVFIDAEDRACAVGYLMIESGWDEQAREISAHENLEYLPDMESAAVEQWVLQSGLTAEEAAWIQPTYNPCDECGCTVDPVCGADGTTYSNSCYAEHCGGTEVVEDFCCEPNDEISDGQQEDFWWCGENPNDSGEEHCPEVDDDERPGESDAGGSDADAGGADADAGWNFDEDDENDDLEGSREASACSAVSSTPTSGGVLLVLVALVALVGRRRRSIFTW